MNFSYRKYKLGDEVFINELYHSVIGRKRSIEKHAWQWLQTPGGESEMWLIEASRDDGKKKLIGHHGVMALEFSYNGEPIRVGKTENTMVLPDFRDKILYPRYEMRFISEYKDNFHALFSTMGPSAAIRLRKAMGYKAKNKWYRIYLGTEPFLSISLVNYRLNRDKFFVQKKEVPQELLIDNTKIKSYIKDAAIEKFDFDYFWGAISKKYGLTPSRTEKSLSWRFFNNPYREYITLILDNEALGIAVCILSVRARSCVWVDDIFCENLESIPRFMELVQSWAKKVLRINFVISYVTTDTLKYFQSKKIKNTTWIEVVLNHKNEKFMPRKVTEVGKKNGIGNESEWFVTPNFFEGRS